MAQNLDLNVNVNTDQAGKALGSLKSQLKEAQAEVAALSDKFGATSKEAIEAAKRAGELKDAIGDAKSLTDAFNPDAKFKSLTASLSGVAGGFAAVQGAMGLLGAESEDAQKMLLKVQSAMAISQGLQSVGEAVDSFKQLGAVIKSTTLFQSAYNFVLGNEKVAVGGNIIALQAKTVATEAQTVATVEQGVATVTTTTAIGASTAAMKALYAPKVPPEATLITTTSLVLTVLQLTTNTALALGAICALAVIIWPEGVLIVTAVVLLLVCVTVS